MSDDFTGDRHAASKEWARTFKDIAQRMTFEEQLTYMQETAKMSDFDSRADRLNAAQHVALTYVDDFDFAKKNIERVFRGEFQLMQASCRTDPEVSCAILGIRFRRHGARKDFLETCTPSRMADFFNKVSPQDPNLRMIYHGYFAKAMRGDPELRERLQAINDAVQGHVRQSSVKARWTSYAASILNPVDDVVEGIEQGN